MKKAILEAERMKLDLCKVQTLSVLYGLDGIYDECVGHIEDLDYCIFKKDKSLLFSSIKLSSRFLCTACCILCSYVSRDIRDCRLSNKSFELSNFVDSLKFLVSKI